MKRVSVVLGLLLAFGFGAPAFAATNVIVNVTGNNNTDPCNATLIGKTAGFEITSYSIGGTLPASAGNSGPGGSKLSLSDLVISKTFDVCSGELVKDFITGKLLSTVTLYDYRQGGGSNNFDFLTITLSGVVIDNYQLSDAASQTPTESIALSYSKVCIANTQQNPNGTPGTTNTGTTNTVCYTKATNTSD